MLLFNILYLTHWPLSSVLGFSIPSLSGDFSPLSPEPLIFNNHAFWPPSPSTLLSFLSTPHSSNFSVFSRTLNFLIHHPSRVSPSFFTQCWFLIHHSDPCLANTPSFPYSSFLILVWQNLVEHSSTTGLDCRQTHGIANCFTLNKHRFQMDDHSLVPRDSTLKWVLHTSFFLQTSSSPPTLFIPWTSADDLASYFIGKAEAPLFPTSRHPMFSPSPPVSLWPSLLLAKPTCHYPSLLFHLPQPHTHTCSPLASASVNQLCQVTRAQNPDVFVLILPLLSSKTICRSYRLYLKKQELQNLTSFATTVVRATISLTWIIAAASCISYG